MRERAWVMLSLSLLLLVFNPVYAEVTSLQTGRSLYSIDMQISFTGSTESADSQKLVNLVIQDPYGKIVLMTGGFAEPNGTFHITVNTNDESQFGIKGTYSATAFVNEKSTGKTIFFDFSPDGSPVAHVVPQQSAVGTSKNSGTNTTQYGLGSKRYEYSLYESPDISDKIAASKNSILATSGQLAGPNDLSGVVYPVMIAFGAAIVGFIFYRRVKRSKVAGGDKLPEPASEEGGETDYAMMILKNRLAKGEITIDEFKATKAALGES